MTEQTSQDPTPPYLHGGRQSDASPVRRAWVAAALMVTLFSLLFPPSLSLVPYFSTSTADWAGLGYIVIALLVYGATMVVLIPAVSFTLGRYIDRRTQAWSDLKAAWLFAAVAATMGAVVGVPFTLQNSMGVLPHLNYIVVPAVAAFGTRLLLPVALRFTAVRVIAIVWAIYAAVSGGTAAISIAMTVRFVG